MEGIVLDWLKDFGRSRYFEAAGFQKAQGWNLNLLPCGTNACKGIG